MHGNLLQPRSVGRVFSHANGGEVTMGHGAWNEKVSP
jgi:hypothetical protein